MKTELQKLTELFTSYSLFDLFDEILNLERGDLWDGLMSKGHKERYYLAKEIFQSRLQKITENNSSDSNVEFLVGAIMDGDVLEEYYLPASDSHQRSINRDKLREVIAKALQMRRSI